MVLHRQQQLQRGAVHAAQPEYARTAVRLQLCALQIAGHRFGLRASPGVWRIERDYQHMEPEPVARGLGLRHTAPDQLQLGLRSAVWPRKTIWPRLEPRRQHVAGRMANSGNLPVDERLSVHHTGGWYLEHRLPAIGKCGIDGRGQSKTDIRERPAVCLQYRSRG